MDNEKLQLLQQKVTLLRSEGKYKETIEACYCLLENGIESNDYKSILTAYVNSAVSYYCIGDIEEAFKCIELYDSICIQYGDDLDRLNLYNVLFILYDYNNDYYKAKKTLEETIDLGIKLKQYNVVSSAYSNYSHVLNNELRYKDALEVGKLGLDTAKLHKPYSAILEIRVQLNIIFSYIKLKEIDVARQLLNEVINNPILDSFIREKAQCYMLKGEFYFDQNFYKEAFKAFTYAKNLVETYNDINLLNEIQEKRCRLCELMNDIQQGYLVQREYIEVLNVVIKKKLAMTALKLDIKHNISDIEKKANTDYLTGLYNRSYLERTTNDWLKEATIKKQSIACIIFDIDNFKGINDKYGHLLGDEVIKAISKCCNGIIRSDDLVSRYGGDEFVIILKDSTLQDGEEIAKRLKENLRKINIQKHDNIISIQVSIGVADNLNGTVLTFNDLFHLADMRLYKAKQNGKNQICTLE